MSTVVAVQDERGRLVAEQALLTYRSVVKAMEAAPHGRGLACMEEALRSQGHEHLRQMLEHAVSRHAELQKKGSAAVPVRAVDPIPSGFAPRERQSPRWATFASLGAISCVGTVRPA